jgi:cation transport ATPase
VAARAPRQAAEDPPDEEHARAGAEQAAGAKPSTRASRTEAKNAAVRESLEPLEEGERPRAVTIAALVAVALALANIVSWLAGVKIGHKKPAAPGIFSYSALMLIAAYGMWRSKYWAVLGMEAILGILMLIFSVLVFTASNVVTVLISLAVIVPSGALFWFLIKAMARIQMPERAPR